MNASRCFALAVLVAATLGWVGTASADRKRKSADSEPVVAADDAREKVSTDTPSKPGNVDIAGAESDRELAKFVKALKKRFKKDDGYYIVRLVETGVQEEPAREQPIKNANAAYQPYSHVTFEMLHGRQAAIERIVGFLGEQRNPPWQKKAPPKSDKGNDTTASAGTAMPTKRDWQPVDWLPQSEEGLQLAEMTVQRAQQKHDAEVKALEELNKPKCACKRAAGG